jgi:DNA-binding NarL/FixJ family response regulator
MMLPDIAVTEAEDANQTLKILSQHPIDLVILDINLAHSSGLTLANHLFARWPKIKIIFFSMFDEPTVVNRAMTTGAQGYLSKRSKPEVMIEAIKTVSSGRNYIEHSIAISLATHNLKDRQSICEQLTKREFDVFLSVAKGQDRSQIAADLNISNKTVSNAITQLKNKLNINTNTELVHLAIEQGLVKIAC